MFTRASGKANWLAAISLTVIAAAFLLLTAAPRARLHAQSSEPPQSLTLVGDWVLTEIISCGFEDVLSADNKPGCEAAPDPVPVRITHQKGRAFASSSPDGRIKLTGAVAEDGSVAIQVIDGNTRSFLSGAISVSESTLEVRGIGYSFEDWRAQIPSMSSFQFKLTKQR